MDKPTLAISVVIPCYKCANTIQRAVDSVAAQTQLPEEVILVDDASGDDTIDILMALQNRYGRNWIRVIELKQNGGPSVARNTGWEASTQPYIAFLDADDVWHPQKSEIQFEWMQAHPDAVMTGSKCPLAKNIQQELKLPKFKECNHRLIRPFYLLIFSGEGISTPTWLIRRNLPYRFNPAKRRSEDYLFQLQIALGQHSIYCFETPLAFTCKGHYGHGGLSKDLWKMEKGELHTYWQLRSEKHFSWVTALCLTIFSLLKHMRRILIVNSSS